MRRIIGLSPLHALHIAYYSLVSWHIPESWPASKTSASLLIKDVVLSYTHAAYDLWQRTLFVCVNGPPIRSSQRKSAGIPWSHNPVAGGLPNWSQHTSCDSVTWDVSDLTGKHVISLSINDKATKDSAHVSVRRGWNIYSHQPGDRFHQAGRRRVTRACSKCFLLSHRMPVTHRLSLNRNILLWNYCMCTLS